MTDTGKQPDVASEWLREMCNTVSQRRILVDALNELVKTELRGNAIAAWMRNELRQEIELLNRRVDGIRSEILMRGGQHVDTPDIVGQGGV